MTDNDVFQLGLRPADPDRPVLRLSSMLSGRLPHVPLVVDHYSAVHDFGLYGNDRYQVCGPTTVANLRKMTTKILTGTEQSPSQADVFDLYRRSGNPRFDPATGAGDNGVVMADMMSALVHGGIAGVRPVAYAQVDVTNLAEVRAATAIFGALALGCDLEAAQRKQTETGLWDVQRSAWWGGHAVPAVGYTSAANGRDLTVVTWSKLVGVTDRFWARQVTEAWVVIWPEMLGTAQFLQGIDAAAANAAYRELTGRPGPFPSVALPVGGRV